MLYDARREEKLVNALLYSLWEIEGLRLDARKLLSNIRINYWNKSPTYVYVEDILVKLGKKAKPVLFEILKDKEKFDFSWRCLKRIGVSDEEISRIFPKPVMLQIYEFMYSQATRRKNPKTLNLLWQETEILRKDVPGKTDWLEHLLLHIFASFNFVTMNVAPLSLEGVDIVCFYPETLDLFIIGCTTGILKDDLVKMNSIINKMEKQMTDLFNLCSISPIVVYSEDAVMASSDEKYAEDQDIAVFQNHNIDKLLEMLNTNKSAREVIKYVDKCKHFEDE